MLNSKCQIVNKKKARFQSKYWKFEIGNFTGIPLLHSQEKLESPALQAGFTLPELVIVIAITAILAGIMLVSLYGSQHRVDMHAAVNVLVSDIRQQQLKAMTGDTSGTGIVINYGIYFQSSQYTLFQGNSYSANAASNFTVTLDSKLQFVNDLFPNTTLLFDPVTGKFINFTSGANTIQVRDTSTNQTTTVTVNRLGVVTGVN